MAADWLWTRRVWEKWAAKYIAPSGKQVQAALLLNYDPSGPSRLLPVIFNIEFPVTEGILFWMLTTLETPFSLCRAEQEGARLTAVDMQPFLDFVNRGNLQTEFFSIKPNQCMMVLLLQLHKQWWLLISLQCSLTGELTNFSLA
nr:unnamed protein product [Digitaria exilis]